MCGGLADDDVDKCLVLHFGYNNVKVDLELGGKLLVAHESERDLRVVVPNDLKVDQQCCKAASDRSKQEDWHD